MARRQACGLEEGKRKQAEKTVNWVGGSQGCDISHGMVVNTALLWYSAFLSASPTSASVSFSPATHPQTLSREPDQTSQLLPITSFAVSEGGRTAFLCSVSFVSSLLPGVAGFELGSWNQVSDSHTDPGLSLLPPDGPSSPTLPSLLKISCLDLLSPGLIRLFDAP